MDTQDRAGLGMNDSGTGKEIGAPVTQRRSGPVLQKGKVYFIKCGGAVKIGFSIDPKLRLKELQTATPDDLELLGAMAGTTETEDELQARFAEYQIRGEWFRADPVLLDFIARSIIKEGPVVEPKNRSGFEFEDTRRDLIATMVKHGADSPIGHRASNIVQLMKQAPPPAALLQRQMAELQTLLAAR